MDSTNFVIRFIRKHLGTVIRKTAKNMFMVGAQIDKIYDTPILSYRCRPSFKTFDENFCYTDIPNTISKIQDQLQLPTKEQKLQGYCIPNLSKASFIGVNSIILGDVSIGDKSSIGFGVHARGDLAKIIIGKGCHILDNTYLQPSVKISCIDKKVVPAISGRILIEDNVVIGANCYIDSCKISRNAVISPGAYISEGCVIGERSMVAAGALIAENTMIPSGQIWAGNPAKYLRDVTAEEKIEMDSNLSELAALAKVYNDEMDKSTREFIEDEIMEKESNDTSLDHKLISEFQKRALPLSYDDSLNGHERLNLDSYSKNSYSEDGTIPEYVSKSLNKLRVTSYDQDLSKYPEVMQMFSENYDLYDKMKKRFESSVDLPFKPSEAPLKKEKFSKFVFKNFDSTHK